MYGSVYTSSFKPPEELVSKVQSLAKSTKTGLKFVDIPYAEATEETLVGYGEIVKDFEHRPVHITQWPNAGPLGVSGGCDGGTTIGEFDSVWEKDHCYVRNKAVGGSYHNGWKEGNHIFFQDANYHPDGEQIFWSVDRKPFIMILSKYPDDLTITPLDFVAFYFDASFGFAVTPGVYHLAVFPAENDKVSLISKQGKVHGVVLTDFLREFGVYGRVPNAWKKPPTWTTPSEFNKIPAESREEFHKPTTPIADNMVETEKPSPVTLKTTPASVEAFEPYGRIIPIDKALDEKEEISILAWPGNIREVYLGNEAGVRSSNFTVEWDYLLGTEPNELILHRTNTKIAEAGCIYKANSYHVDKLRTRIDGGNLIYPLEDGEFVVLVAESAANGEPSFESFRAFSIPQDTAILLKPRIWCGFPIPVKGSKKMTFEEKFNAVNARLEVSLAKDYKNLIKIVL